MLKTIIGLLFLDPKTLLQKGVLEFQTQSQNAENGGLHCQSQAITAHLPFQKKSIKQNTPQPCSQHKSDSILLSQSSDPHISPKTPHPSCQ